jgi:FeS assembly SUF system protein
LTGAEGLAEETKTTVDNTAAELNPVEVLDLESKVVEALRTIYDPEIPVDVYELGLIYDLKVDTSGVINLQMTLTTPNCPEGASIPSRIEAKLRTVPGVRDVKLEIVWEPPWTPNRMSEAAKLQLGFL